MTNSLVVLFGIYQFLAFVLMLFLGDRGEEQAVFNPKKVFWLCILCGPVGWLCLIGEHAFNWMGKIYNSFEDYMRR